MTDTYRVEWTACDRRPIASHAMPLHDAERMADTMRRAGASDASVIPAELPLVQPAAHSA